MSKRHCTLPLAALVNISCKIFAKMQPSRLHQNIVIILPSQNQTQPKYRFPLLHTLTSSSPSRLPSSFPQNFTLFSAYPYQKGGAGRSVGIATGYGLDGPGIEFWWGEIFRTCPDRPWGPPSLLYKGYGVFPWDKERPGRDADTSPPSSAVVMKG